jgi:hypothetical protein
MDGRIAMLPNWRALLLAPSREKLFWLSRPPMAIPDPLLPVADPTERAKSARTGGDAGH